MAYQQSLSKMWNGIKIAHREMQERELKEYFASIPGVANFNFEDSIDSEEKRAPDLASLRQCIRNNSS